jgi:hypothetical protein
MIIDQTLSAWLADRRAQERAERTIGSVAHDLRRIPALDRLHTQLPAAEAAGADSVLSLARAFSGDDLAIEMAVRNLVAAASADPFFRPPARPVSSEVHRGLLLFHRPALSIQLAVMSADALAGKRSFRHGRASIHFTGQRTIFRFLRSGGATLSFWEAPSGGASFTFAGSGRCALIERRRIRDGEEIEIDGSNQSFIIDHAPRDLVYVQAATPVGAAPLAVEYDAETLEAIGTSSTDDASSRTQMMLALLRLMDRRDAVPLFEEMVAGEHFYARWQAMREFLALDAGAALPHLQFMVRADPHPEVRAAAAQTLEAFFPQEMEPLLCHV